MLLKYRQIIESKFATMQIAAEMLKQPIQKTDYVKWITEQKEKSKQKSLSSNSAQQNISLQLF
jgi:hypothetical protein